MAKASPVTAAQERAALARPPHDPPTRADGACYVCLGERGRVALKHDDPFCTSRCARSYHGVELAIDRAGSPP